MKRLFTLLVGVFLISACCHEEIKSNEETQSNECLMPETEEYEPDMMVSDSLCDIWFKYDSPQNGYDIMIHCRQAFDEEEPDLFSIELFLTKGKNTIHCEIPQLIALARFMQGEYGNGKEVIKLHNTHKTLGGPFLDHNNIVYFADIDFDWEKELMVCLTPFVDESVDCLDCDKYLVYEIDGGNIYRCDNSFTREINGDLCRTTYSVDKKKKTITLTGSSSAFEYVEKVFWFRKGQPYKVDYIHSDGGVEKEYHFNLPE